MPEVTAKDIDRIVEGEGTKADKARRLYALSDEITRNDVVELLGMNYSQAHSIWKARGNPTKARIGRVSRKALDSSERKTANSKLRFSPTQVRYLTQAGHEIYRVDDETGMPVCRRCRDPLTYSIQALGFLHTFSSEPVTDAVDHYPGNPEEVFDVRRPRRVATVAMPR